MELLKGLGEAVGAVVPVSKGDVDHLLLAGGQLRPSDGQAAVPDVFAQRIPAQDAEYALEMKGRRQTFPGDAIVVGIANNQSPKTPIDLTFTFADGSSCTFYFVQENTVRISGQNYVLEDGGKLWRLLADVSGSAETESEVFAETELEVTAETKSEIIVETESEAESEAITEAE